MKLLVTNIAYLCGTDTKRPTRLCGAEMQRFEVTERAYLLIENGRFASFDPETALTADMRMGAEVIDAQGGTVMPSWCDAHTHIVYAGSREGEFVDKIRGLSYEEIARRGGAF